MRPGHENLVAMGAISTVADDAIKRKSHLISIERKLHFASLQELPTHWPSNVKYQALPEEGCHS